MASKARPRYKSGPKKGKFMSNRAIAAQKAARKRKRNPPTKRTTARKRTTTRKATKARRSTRRRNPPKMKPMKKLKQGLKDAGGVTVGKAVARFVPTQFGLPKQGLVGLAVQAAVGLGAAMAADRFLNKDTARMILAGALSAPLETLAVAHVPVLGPALAPVTAQSSLQSYAGIPRRQMASYARPRSPRVLSMPPRPGQGSGISSYSGSGMAQQ